MTEYDAGEAFLQIVPSFRGVQRAIDAEVSKWNRQIREGISNALPAGLREGARSVGRQGEEAGDAFGGAFARTVRRRIEAGLKALPKVEINADSTETDLKLAAIRAQLEELRTKRIGIDIDEGQALAELTAITAQLRELGASDASIQVRTDTAAAASELALVQAEVDRLDGRTAHVQVDVDTQAGGAGLPGIGGGGFGLGALGALASPLLAPFGAAGLGGLAGIGTVAAAGAGGIATLILSLSDVNDAIKDVAAAHAEAGAAGSKASAEQVRAALAVAGAERALKSAQDALANARANAADAAVRAQDRVASALQQQERAERAVTSALKAEQDAQEALTEARKTAAEQIEDVNNAVADGAIAQKQAELDVRQAKQRMQDVQGDPQSSSLERRQAKLDYEQAVQRLKDLQVQQGRLVDKQTDAVTKGVDGSDAVRTAQERLDAASQGVADAYQAQADAAKNVTSALRDQQSQARQSAFAIGQAQTQILNALAAVQTASASDVAQAQERLDDMNPALRGFATFVEDTLKPALEVLQGAAQAGFLPGLQAGLEAVMPLLKPAADFIGGLAKVMGDLATEAGQALTSPFWVDFFDFVSRMAGPTLDTFLTAMGNIVVGLAGLLEAFEPVVTAIGDGVRDLTDRFADFGRGLDSNSSFQSFLAYVQEVGPDVAHFFGDIFRLAGKLLEGLAPLGAMMLDLINQVLDLIDKLGPGQLLLAIGTVGIAIALIGGPVTALVIGLTAIAGAVAYAYENFQPFHDFVDKYILPILQILADKVLAGVRAGFEDVTDAISGNKEELHDLGSALSGLMGFIVKYVAPVVGDVLGLQFRVLGKAIAAVIEVISFLVDAAETLASVGGAAFTRFKEDAQHAKDGIVTAWNAVVEFFKKLPGRISTAANGLWDGLTDGFTAAMNGLISAWNSIDFSIDVSVPDWVPGFGGKGWHSGDLFPDIPPLGKALGGVITGPGSGTSDSAGLFALSNGEFVQRTAAVEHYGLPFMQAINNLTFPGFAAGGPVGYDAKALATLMPPQSAPLLDHQALRALSSGPEEWTIGEYHQHFVNPVPEPASFSASKGGRRMLQTLNG